MIEEKEETEGGGRRSECFWRVLVGTVRREEKEIRGTCEEITSWLGAVTRYSPNPTYSQLYDRDDHLYLYASALESSYEG
jgi:hypothetical protein